MNIATIHRSLGPIVVHYSEVIQKGCEYLSVHQFYSRRAAPAALEMGGCLHMASPYERYVPS